MRIMGAAMHQGRKPAPLLEAGVISGCFFWGATAAIGILAVLAREDIAGVVDGRSSEDLRGPSNNTNLSLSVRQYLKRYLNVPDCPGFQCFPAETKKDA